MALAINKKQPITNIDEKKEKSQLLGEIAVQTKTLEEIRSSAKQLEDSRPEAKKLLEEIEVIKTEISNLQSSKDILVQELSVLENKKVELSKELDSIPFALEEKNKQIDEFISDIDNQKKIKNEELESVKNQIKQEQDKNNLFLTSFEEKVAKKQQENDNLDIKKNGIELAIKNLLEEKTIKESEYEIAVSNWKEGNKKLNEINTSIEEAKKAKELLDKDIVDAKKELEDYRLQVLEDLKQKTIEVENEKIVQDKRKEDIDWREKNLSSKIAKLKQIKVELEKIHGKKLDHIIIE